MPRQPKTKVSKFKGFPSTHPRFEEFKNRVGLPFMFNPKGRWGKETVYYQGKGRVRIDNRTGTLFRPLKIWKR
tara:strand:- start:347 stop:565 length:219 start_codon:yes stop_codon:yes gene_type:complete